MAKIKILNQFLLIIIFSLIFTLSITQKSSAWIGRMDNQASLVIGQTDFEHVSANQGGAIGANTLNRPRGVWESDGRLAITDWMNNRILIYNTIPIGNNPSADVVIGQQNFTSGAANQGGAVSANTLSQPGGISGGKGKFVVCDDANNRVLIFNGLPDVNNASAVLVLGQPDMTHNSYIGPTSSSMSIPEDVWTDGNKIIVADRSNNRVLIWHSMPTTNGQPADVVVGQLDFTSNLANQGGAVSANTLKLPNGVASDGKKMFIADSGNARVLIYNQIPTTNNASADVVVGQPDFNSSAPNQGLTHPEAYTMGGDDSPQRVYSEGVRLYVCDKGNQRILVFNTVPTTNNASADAVFGQPDFTSNGAKTGALGVSSPRGIFAGANHFYVTDRSYHRVLVFKLAPEDILLSINNGASSTLSHQVILSISAIGANEMMLSNSADFSNATWEPFATKKEWNLANGNSIKTVYGKFRDWGNFESPVVSASIDLPSSSLGSSSTDLSSNSEISSELPGTGTSIIFLLCATFIIFIVLFVVKFIFNLYNYRKFTI